MKNFYYLLIFLAYSYQLNGFSTPPIQVLDSLINVSEDVSKMDEKFFNHYIKTLNQTSSPQRLIYAQKGISLADKTKNGDFSAMMIQDFALYYASIDSIQIAARLAKQAYEVAEEPSRKRSLAGYIGIFNSIQSHYRTAVDYYLKEIEWCEKLERPELKGAPYNNIAELFVELKRYDKALEYAQKAYQLNLPNKPEIRFVAYGATILGQIYQAQNQLDSAEFYYKEAVEIVDNQLKGLVDNQRYYHMRSHAYYHISRFYRETNNNKLALIFADSSATSLKHIQDMAFEYSIYINTNLAKCYLNLERLSEAEEAISHLNTKMQKSSYPLQQLYYEYKVAYAVKTNNFKEAYQHEKTLRKLQEKIYDNEKEQYLLLSLEDLDIPSEENPNKTANKLKRKYRNISILVVAAFILLIVGIFITFGRRKNNP